MLLSFQVYQQKSKILLHAVHVCMTGVCVHTCKWLCFHVLWDKNSGGQTSDDTSKTKVISTSTLCLLQLDL